MTSKSVAALRRIGIGVCLVVPIAMFVGSGSALAQKKPAKTKMDTPVISCADATNVGVDVEVCAGATGAPAGFSLQWITAEQYALGPDGVAGTLDDNSWPASDSADLCKASFSGNANQSTFNLAPNACVTVDISDSLFDEQGASSNCANVPLVCGTDYVFRAFTHANSTLMRSDFTANQTCSTLDCEELDNGCTLTQGYWKTHGPIPTGNNSNEWPQEVIDNGMNLGNVTYTALELQAIFDNPAAGNGLISLAHQLIAAKLNVASGADGSSIAGAIAAADALIGDLVVPPVGAGSLPNSQTSSLTGELALFNEGTTGPGHCD
jgi:hypothetical protein